MRPVLVIPATLVLIATLALAYFAGAPAIGAGTLSRNEAVSVEPPAGINLLGATPVTLSFSNLPRGSYLVADVCSSTCSLNPTPPPFSGPNAGVLQSTVFNTTSGSFTFQLTGTQTIFLYATAGGVSYHTSSPLWATYSTLFLLVILATFIVGLVGLILREASNQPRRSKGAQEEPMPSPARDTGGYRYTAPSYRHQSQWPPPPEEPSGTDPNAPYSPPEWEEV